MKYICKCDNDDNDNNTNYYHYYCYYNRIHKFNCIWISSKSTF